MKKRYVVLIVLLLMVLAVAIAANVFMKKTEAGLAQLSRMTLEDPDLASLADGVYEGSHEVFPVKVVVSVTLADHGISDVRIVEHRQGKGREAERLVPLIVEHQSVELDVISGATYSSKVLLKAVELALTSASK